MADRRAKLGAAAERHVADTLRRDDYEILDRNWFARVGELDIVALDHDILVFVEVRARVGSQFGTADESVGKAKLRRIFSAAQHYIQRHPDHGDRFWRVDLVALTLSRSGELLHYRHYENMTLD